MGSSSTATRHLFALRCPKNAAGLRFSLHFRPLQKLRVPFFRRRQLELAILRAREGFAGRRGRQPLQEHGAAGRPLRHPAGRDTPGDTSPCAGEVIRAAEGVGPYGIWEGGARSPSQSTGGRTRRLTAPPEGGAKWRALHFGKGVIAGDGRSFGLHNLYLVYIFWFT